MRLRIIILLFLSLCLASLISCGKGGEKAETKHETPSLKNPMFDKSFGIGGIVITNADNYYDIAYALEIQSDGRILVAGYTSDGTQKNVLLIRYNTDGSLDKTFGSSGIVITDISGYDDIAYSLNIQPDGRILAAGYTSDGTQKNVLLIRYNADGSLDKTFGADGIVITDIRGYDDIAYSLNIQPDGRILVTGSTSDGAYNDVLLIRYSADGLLDKTFGTDGIVITDINGFDDFANTLGILPDGRIVVAGATSKSLYSYNTDVAVLCYNTDGSLDTTFGSGGITTTAVNTLSSASDLAIQPDGKILVTGFTTDGAYNDILLIRYNADGSLDKAFGSDGILIADIGDYDVAYAIEIQADGKILVSGGTSAGDIYSNKILVACYNPDGTFDESFGNNGIVISDAGGNNDIAYSLKVQFDNKIIVSGSTYNGTDSNVFVIRLSP